MSSIDLNETLKEFRFKMPVYVRWSDLDEVGHVNNSVYLTYIEQNRITYFAEAVQWDWKKVGIILANVNINYIRPLFYPEDTFIYMRVTRIGTKSLETEHVIVVENSSAGSETKIELVSRATTVLVTYDYKTNASMAIPQEIREKLEAFEKRTF